MTRTEGTPKGPKAFTGYVCPASDWTDCYKWSLDEEDIVEHLKENPNHAD